MNWLRTPSREFSNSDRIRTSGNSICALKDPVHAHTKRIWDHPGLTLGGIFVHKELELRSLRSLGLKHG
jgi:hypothetical protein